MRKLLSIGCLLAAGSMLWAQPDEAKLRDAMKQIGPTCSGLGKKIAAKDATSAEDAKKLQAWFGDVHKFWKGRKAEDGITFSKTAAAEFKAISKLSAAGKWDEAGVSFKKATATCSGCHSAHREKAADGSWKVK
ncbi:MAG: hypothetical protein SFV51_13070 [Bryobacteraceae bacterium]|nr:hypothetical protein [Bryobacteraceae bacterium]